MIFPRVAIFASRNTPLPPCLHAYLLSCMLSMVLHVSRVDQLTISEVAYISVNFDHVFPLSIICLALIETGDFDHKYGIRLLFFRVIPKE